MQGATLQVQLLWTRADNTSNASGLPLVAMTATLTTIACSGDAGMLALTDAAPGGYTLRHVLLDRPSMSAEPPLSPRKWLSATHSLVTVLL